MSTGQEDARAWTHWIESTEGEVCSAGSASGTHLENRLWRAFMAGRREEVIWTGGAAAGSNSPKGPRC